ncbi:MAG: 6-phosphogluconolactonase [Actinobacteria bacterium]|nr:6-phosphogluconolactonase [Actinomycetota bacterium]
MEVTIAPTARAAASLAAALIERRLRSAVSRRGVATLAVSGGATPGPMFAELALASLPWERITVFQVDERVAPDGHPDRNLGIVQPLAGAGATVVPMPVTDADLPAAAARYATLLPERFDVVHLGIGDDGHTASWPPGDPVADVALPVALSGEYQGRIRMTLTPGPVNAARLRVVLVAGASKRQALDGWLSGDRSVPIHRVHRTNTIVVADAAAAPAGAS